MNIKRTVGIILATGLVVTAVTGAFMQRHPQAYSPDRYKRSTVDDELPHAKPEARRPRTRPTLVMCKRAMDAPAIRPPGPVVDLGHGISVRAKEHPGRDVRSNFRITYRSGGRFVDIHGDGTVDAGLNDGALSRALFRYHVPRREVTLLAADLRRLNVWARRPLNGIGEGLIPTIDVTMDGRTETRIRQNLMMDRGGDGPAIEDAIVKAAHLNDIAGDLSLRLKLLDASGFRFDSSEGADLALGLVLSGRYSEGDLKALLGYRFPCAGGLYETFIFPPMHDMGAWSLQEALKKRGFTALATRFGPAPVIRPDPPIEPPYPPDRPQEGLAWTIFPTQAQIQAAYPVRAREDEVEGTATVTCDATRDGHLKCRALSEKPPGYGFGPATVRLFEAQGRVRVERPGAPPKNGRVTLHWTLP